MKGADLVKSLWYKKFCLDLITVLQDVIWYIEFFDSMNMKLSILKMH